MLKNISNLGSVLNKTEQQIINGGSCYDIWDYCDSGDATFADFEVCMKARGC